ncbi:MAG: nuclear transport factor 2 family protein [Dehalococcoidia bacterium]|nr:nuclear transport factor 2 family protein [Dehalococcoidia bacterium]
MSLSVEDQLAIQQLYARYNHAIDFGRADEWAACFTADGVFSSGASGEFTGTEALSAFAKGFAERIKARHWINNLVLEASDEGAQGSCYLQLLRLGGDTPASILTTGVYEDTLVCTPEGWKFVRRTVTPDA